MILLRQIWCEALSREEVALDVELLNGVHRDVATSSFAPLEKAYVSEYGSTHQEAVRFYEVWTGKESYSKAIGRATGAPGAVALASGEAGGFTLRRSRRQVHQRESVMNKSDAITGIVPGDSLKPHCRAVPPHRVAEPHDFCDGY